MEPAELVFISVYNIIYIHINFKAINNVLDAKMVLKTHLFIKNIHIIYYIYIYIIHIIYTYFIYIIHILYTYSYLHIYIYNK